MCLLRRAVQVRYAFPNSTREYSTSIYMTDTKAIASNSIILMNAHISDHLTPFNKCGFQFNCPVVEFIQRSITKRIK